MKKIIFTFLIMASFLFIGCSNDKIKLLDEENTKQENRIKKLEAKVDTLEKEIDNIKKSNNENQTDDKESTNKNDIGKTKSYDNKSDDPEKVIQGLKDEYADYYDYCPYCGKRGISPDTYTCIECGYNYDMCPKCRSYNYHDGICSDCGYDASPND